jgi:hypothetical protein
VIDGRGGKGRRKVSRGTSTDTDSSTICDSSQGQGNGEKLRRLAWRNPDPAAAKSENATDVLERNLPKNCRED